MSNVDAAKALIDSQATKGLSKYGVPLERSDATVSQLARHGSEEMADALAYFVELEHRAAALEEQSSLLRSALRFALREAKRTPFNAKEYDASAALLAGHG